MNITQKGILVLLKSAITGECYELPEDFVFDAPETERLIKKHYLMALVYVGAVNCGIPADLPLMQKLFAFYCRHLVHSENQMREVKKVFQAFEEHGIDYLPVKGCILKTLYPKPEMRTMGDADITLREEQLPLMHEILPPLGFTYRGQEPGGDVWDSGKLHLELHFHMSSFYNQQYYDDVWERTTCENGHRYVFSTEDNFIHVFNHFARHYRCGGIGCRHLVDIYVLRRTFPQMDEAYIMAELEKIHLQKFYKNVCDLLDVWFGTGVLNESTKAISQFIFNSGSWGTRNSHSTAGQVEVANETGANTGFRKKAILKVVVPNLESMKERYPILHKLPFLLPVTWMMRWVKAVFVGKEIVPDLVSQWKGIEDDKVLVYQQHYRRVGLELDQLSDD